LKNYAVDHSAKQAEMAWETYVYGDFTQENAAARLASGKDELELVGKDFGIDEKGRIRLGETTSSGKGGRLIQITDIGDTDTMSVVLGHEAYRNGVVDGNNRSETRNAVIAHTVMADRMRADGTKFSGIVGLDLAVYDYARSEGNMDIMAAYADEMYDSSGEYWRVIKDANGNVVQVLDDGDRAHATIVDAEGNIERVADLDTTSLTGQLAAIVGNGMSKERMNQIMMASGLDYNDVEKWFAKDGGKYLKSDIRTNENLLIPIAPQGVNIDENIKNAKNMNLIEFYKSVKNGGV
jgi:hypothetical protein